LAASVVINLRREATVIDLLQFSDAKAEFPSGSYMPWLAEEEIFRRVVKEFVVIDCDALGIALPQGRRGPFAALLFNRL
jgi:hypothetical protein